MWTVDQNIKSKYLTKFKTFLEQKNENIALEVVEEQMQKPDFIKFFKHLKQSTKIDESTNSETSVE